MLKYLILCALLAVSPIFANQKLDRNDETTVEETVVKADKGRFVDGVYSIENHITRINPKYVCFSPEKNLTRINPKYVCFSTENRLEKIRLKDIC